MDDQNNQDESDDFRSHIPNAMLADSDYDLENALETTNGPGRSSPVTDFKSVPFHEQKWSSLRRNYNDQYLELFRATLAGDREEVSGEDLRASQLGAVVWQPSEKAALYNGVCRKGRHDLQRLSDLVGSKSEIEVKAYLDSLREQEADRQRFEPQTKNVSHADIPAAIEIGPECETLLDQAADAVAAFQEQYDHAAGQRNTTLWLIDQATSFELDQKASEAENASDLSDQGSGDEGELCSDGASSLFHLSAFLTLSEQYFMNPGSDSPDNWRNLAEEGQRPAMTMDVVTSFFDLIVNFTRKLTQSCLFMAQSRIRASTSAAYQPSKVVKYEDVEAALAVLNTKSNADTFWVGLARRNNLSVVDDSRSTPIGRQAVMSYEDVEARLSIPPRRRSMSIMSDDSGRGRASSIEALESIEPYEDGEGISDAGDDTVPPVTEDHPSTGRESDDEASSSSDEQRSRSSDSESEAHPMPPISRQMRIELLQEEQDDYMERMDQEARRLEESRLFQLLGTQSGEPIKTEETPGLGPRPRVMRKTVEECMGWSVQYQAEWEYHGEILPPGSFAYVGSDAKRRRLDPESLRNLPAP